MESGGEAGADGATNSLEKDNLEVSVMVEDLKLILTRLGDLEDPYFKHLEVIREFEGCVWKKNLTENISRKQMMCKVMLIKR